MNNLSKTLVSILIISVGILFVLLVGSFIFLSSKIDNISLLNQPVPYESPKTPPTGLTRSDVEEIVSQAVSSLSGVQKTAISTTTPAPSPTPTAQVANKITFIPLVGSGSTQNATWTDVPNAQIWLNFSGEYGTLAKAWWDAFLRVDNANGTTYARLFDVTHGIAVNGSEISVSATSASTDVESGNLQFWAGRNLYRVQIKSLNSSAAFFDSGRIKISY